MQRQGLIAGTTYLLIAQAVFILSGYAIHVGLGRFLGPSDYGVYSVVIYVATVFNLILTTGLPYAASKFISEDERRSLSVMKTSLNLSVILGIAIFSMIFLGADRIASALNDPTLAPYIQLVSVMVPIYALHSVIAGYYNGLRNYKIQAFLLLLYDISKPIMIFLLVFLGFSEWGAVLGFALGPLLPMVMGFYFMGLQTFWAEAFPYKKLLKFAVPIIVFAVAINLIMSLDLFFVKRILMDNEQAGFYSAASMIAKVPYSLLAALTAALFPAISASMNDREKTREYISESIRYTLLLLVPLTFIVAASSGGLVTLIYSSVYKPAGEPLSILIVGVSFFALFSVLTTVISGSGKPGTSMLLSLMILVADLVSNQILVPLWGMHGAALSTGVSSAIGLLMAAFCVYRQHGVLTSASSTAKILLASSLLFVAISYINPGGLLLILVYILAGVLYLAMLYLLKEIKPRDMARFGRLLKRFRRHTDGAA